MNNSTSNVHTRISYIRQYDLLYRIEVIISEL